MLWLLYSKLPEIGGHLPVFVVFQQYFDVVNHFLSYSLILVLLHIKCEKL